MKKENAIRFTRTYTAIPGLQAAHTVYCSARTVPQGVLLEMRCEQGRAQRCSAVLWPGGTLMRGAAVMQYLAENSVPDSQWLDVLQDLGVAYQLQQGR